MANRYIPTASGAAEAGEPSARPWPAWPKLGLLPLDFALAGLAVAIVVAVTAAYVSSEHVFYWSDYSGYQDIAYGIVARARESLGSAVRGVIESMGADYNALFAIPLVPWILLFGESRLAFEIGLALVYLLPFVLMLGAVATTLIPLAPRAVFWTTVGVALLNPIVWLPTLRGYPDTGGAALIALAVWLYLRDTDLKRWWRVAAIGAALAAAMLFRRHFAYAGTAFFAALALHALARAVSWPERRPRVAWRDLARRAARIALVGLAALLVLGLIGRSFLRRTLTIDYNELYASYLDPVAAVLLWYPAAYGWALAAGGLLGYALAAVRRLLRRESAAFVLLLGGVSLLQWSLLVRQIGEHYTLHFTPAVVLGCAALAWAIWHGTRGRVRALALAALGLLACANMLVSLTPAPIAAGAARPLFALASAPLTRPDYDEVARLVDFLRARAGRAEPIYVVGSSGLMNRGLLRNAERALHGWGQARLDILEVPQIDSRDFLPLEMLLQAQYVVVVEPLQTQLDINEQGVVKAAYDLFVDQHEFARDFARLPETFALENGAKAAVYERLRPTPLPVALRTLRFVEDEVGGRPGGQLDWLALRQAGPVAIEGSAGGGYQLGARSEAGGAEATTFLYLGALPERIELSGAARVEGAGCPGADLRLSRVGAGDRVEPAAEIARRPGDPAEFALGLPRAGADYLLLDVSGIGRRGLDAACTVRVDALRVGG